MSFQIRLKRTAVVSDDQQQQQNESQPPQSHVGHVGSAKENKHSNFHHNVLLSRSNGSKMVNDHNNKPARTTTRLDELSDQIEANPADANNPSTCHPSRILNQLNVSPSSVRPGTKSIKAENVTSGNVGVEDGGGASCSNYYFNNITCSSDFFNFAPNRTADNTNPEMVTTSSNVIDAEFTARFSRFKAQNSNLIQKFMKPNVEVSAEHDSDEDVDNTHQDGNNILARIMQEVPETEVLVPDSPESSQHSITKSRKISNSNRMIRTASADDSIVEVALDKSQPKMVEAINFEILKLPSSSQKISATPRSLISTYPTTGEKQDGKQSTKDQQAIGKTTASCNKNVSSRSQPVSRLKPQVLEKQLARVEERTQSSTYSTSKLKTSKSSISLNGIANETTKADKSAEQHKPSRSLSQSNIEKMTKEKKTPEAKTNEKSSSDDIKQCKPSDGKVPAASQQVKSATKSASGSARPPASSSKTTTTAPAPATSKSAPSNMQTISINKRSYNVLNVLGKGGSSIVYHIYDPNDKRSKALKVVDLSKADGAVVEGFKNEIQLLRKLSHCKRVVRMYDYEFRRNNTQLLIVMEKGDDDLANVLKSYVVEAQSNDGKPRRLDDLLIKFYWREMLYVVQELHANNVVHSDLKPVNFIIVSGKLKLIDFGIAKAIQTNKTSVFNDHVIGTIDFMPPEALLRKYNVNGKSVVKYNMKADIWSLGIILYNLVFSHTPFYMVKDGLQKGLMIINPDTKIEYPDRHQVDPLLLDVIEKCLQHDPSKRPTTEELLNHEYLHKSTKEPIAGATPAPAKAKKDTEDEDEDEEQNILSKIKGLTPNTRRLLYKVIESKQRPKKT